MAVPSPQFEEFKIVTIPYDKTDALLHCAKWFFGFSGFRVDDENDGHKLTHN